MMIVILLLHVIFTTLLLFLNLIVNSKLVVSLPFSVKEPSKKATQNTSNISSVLFLVFNSAEYIHT